MVKAATARKIKVNVLISRTLTVQLARIISRDKHAIQEGEQTQMLICLNIDENLKFILLKYKFDIR